MHAFLHVRLVVASLVVSGALVPLAAQPAPPTAPGTAGGAAAVLTTSPIIDGHNDLPWEMRQRARYDFDRIDIAAPQPQLMTDLPRLRQGHVGGQFWSVYVPAELQGDAAVSATLEQIDAVHEMVRRYPDRFVLARTADDVERAMATGKIASMMGVEGGHSIDSSIATLRMLHRLGAGYMTLTHSRNVPWADSTSDDPKLGGISAFGEEVVREMNRLGMLVDLSHTSPETMADAIRVSRAPVIFSHSNARAVCDVPRNVPDAILRQVAGNGGIVMVTFVPGFVSQDAANYSRRAQAQSQLLQSQFGADKAGLDAAMKAWRTTNPEPRATLTQVADHIDHIRKVAGIDHIGLGGDFDGITSVVQGLEHVGTYPALIAELGRRGYSSDDLAKISGRNILRVMRGAEATAATLRSTAPSLKTIEDVDHVTRRGQPLPPVR
ncbi:dipeptidase [Luteitalea sp.]|uniref:dipeptidase n=1 Tax=Luteitalea sp. TaxID=2004800 RepID=UPI0025BA7D1B|nr:dipeptidase [Luteitalea sp.]